MAEYELFLTRDLSELKEGEEQIVHVRNVVDYEMRVVKAMFTRSPEKTPGADRLWVRSPMGAKSPEPWAIKIVEDLGSVPEYMGLYRQSK